MRSDVLPPALPAFDQLTPDAALDHLKATLATQRARVAELTQREDPSWARLVEPLDDVAGRINNHHSAPERRDR